MTTPTGYNPALSSVTCVLLHTIDAYLESALSAPNRIPDWMLTPDGVSGKLTPEISIQTSNYLAALKALGRAYFDPPLAAVLWWDFWTLAEEVAGLVGDQLGAPLADVLDENNGEVSYKVRPLLTTPDVVAEQFGAVFLLVDMYAYFGDQARTEEHLGEVGSVDSVLRLAAACWLHCLLRLDMVIASR